MQSVWEACTVVIAVEYTRPYVRGADGVLRKAEWWVFRLGDFHVRWQHDGSKTPLQYETEQREAIRKYEEKGKGSLVGTDSP